MKRMVSLLLLLSVLLTGISIPTYAAEPNDEVCVSKTVEYLSDGSYFSIEVFESVLTARSNQKDGRKVATYRNAAGSPIWAVEVHGYFTYDGNSATATSATATVYRYSTDAETLKKDSYVSGASAYASASVEYLERTTSKTVKLTCDKYGNLS